MLWVAGDEDGKDDEIWLFNPYCLRSKSEFTWMQWEDPDRFKARIRNYQIYFLEN